MLARSLCFLLLYFFSSLVMGSDQKALDLLDRMDKLYRLDSSKATMTMDIETPNWQRSMTLVSWSKGMDFTLVRIQSPKKEKGIATLKRENEMWNFFPKANQVIKVPPSMMMGSWMGSDFTNDDLVREESLAEEYEVTLTEDDKFYHLSLVPREDTITVWGKIEFTVDKANLLPVKEVFFNEEGEAMREMMFSKVTNFDGKLLPAVLELRPLNKTGHKTRIVYDELTFNVEISDSIFTLRNLKKKR